MNIIEENRNGDQCSNKRLKPNLNFWSPLNDSFALPDKKSKCTWQQKNDGKTNPHEISDW